MKRILAMVLAGILTVSVIPAFAAAEVGSATDKGSNRQLGTTAEGQESQGQEPEEGEENPPTEAQSGELPAALNLKYKAKKKLVLANTQPEGLPVNVTWASDNAGIAAVDKNGTVTAKWAGKCEVSAVFPSGSRAVCKVTVEPKGLKYKKKTIRKKARFTNVLVGAKTGVKWSSSNKKVATVNGKGVVKGRKSGTCKVVARFGGKKYACKVTVVNPRLNKKKITVYNSRSFRLKVTGGKGRIRWKSGNKKVATVSKKGTVTALKGGTCTVTAVRNGIALKCRITVPKHYKGYKIPDFGALYGKRGKFRKADGVTSVQYKAGKKTYQKYLAALKKKNFTFVEKSSGTLVYMNSAGEMVAAAYADGYVGLAFGNIKDIE
ncbi:MAG: Ig-like domain-containing protein [Mogibacterium sp.]|uniref:Ig-like domain-containing protein n=1 Tax=Mogibacterium sp. TaxID=2049035 RepID=UPI001A61714C|nr:Ig-like domain-containing protein [Mogibacterium sp.]MBL6467949.1 Ig-like domain-containing protein [Mogibacterium sp.]